jgi:hypothetical protein
VLIAPEITSNPKFSFFFDNVISAIDGTQVNCMSSSTERQNAHNHKGGIMHNGISFQLCQCNVTTLVRGHPSM